MKKEDIGLSIVGNEVSKEDERTKVETADENAGRRTFENEPISEGKRFREERRTYKSRRGERTGFLVSHERYLEAGVHIGTKVKTGPMREFIYMRRNDGLYVLDIKKTDERIRKAGKILAQYEPDEILITASRVYSSIAGANFAKVTGTWLYPGRFIPGVLTNPSRPDFMEPKIIIVSDPRGEREAIVEAGKMGIPVIALCDTDNVTRYIDYVIPCNNKGRKSLALVFYLLAREYLVSSGKIGSYSEFKYPIKMFTEEHAVDEIRKIQEERTKRMKAITEKEKPVVEMASEIVEGTKTEEELSEEETDSNVEAEPPAEDIIKKKVPLESYENRREKQRETE